MADFADRPEMTKVLPLVSGLTGINYQTNEPSSLLPYVPGYMDWDDAIIARDASEVEILVHESTATRSYASDVVLGAPIIASAEVSELTPDEIVLTFDKRVSIDDITGLSLTGTTSALIGNATASLFSILIKLDSAILLGETANVVYNNAQTSNIRHALEASSKTISFTEAVDVSEIT